MLDVDIRIPDLTTFSRRGAGLTMLLKRIERNEPLLVNRTCVKLYGEGEWRDEEQGVRSGRRWRKLHRGVVAAELTLDDVGDVSTIVDLHDQSDRPVAPMIGDGAYDGEAGYDAVAKRNSEAASTKHDTRLQMLTRYGRIG